MNPTTPQVSSLAPSHRPWGALLLLLMSYGLVLLAPVAFHSLHLAAAGFGQPIHVADWVPVTLAVGLALLGGAAMVTVLMRLVRELESSPYAGVAAAFGVLMGSALIALRAPFQLGQLNSGACAVLCLLVSIAGGALTLRPGFGAAVTGGVIALLPAPLLVSLLWLDADQARSVPALLASLPSADRTFIGLTALFGFLLWLVSLSSRNAATRFSKVQRSSANDFALTPTMVVPVTTTRSMASEPTERVSVWSFHDAPPSPEDFEFPELRSRWGGRKLWFTLILLSAASTAAYFWSVAQR